MLKESFRWLPFGENHTGETPCSFCKRSEPSVDRPAQGISFISGWPFPTCTEHMESSRKSVQDFDTTQREVTSLESQELLA